MEPIYFDTGGQAEIRRGDWREVLAGITADAVICDPPYGSRIHESKPTRRDAMERAGSGYDAAGLTPSYDAWTASDVRDFVTSWSPRCRGWIVALTSHDLAPAWETAYDLVDRYCFAPVPCVINAMSVRLAGDGPSSWSVLAIVARPRTKEAAGWGTLPGAYVGNRSQGSSGGRGKPDWLMRALVRDYSRAGDLVVDPFAGWGATLTAAVGLGRRALGAEIDGDAYETACARLGRPVQRDLFG